MREWQEEFEECDEIPEEYLEENEEDPEEMPEKITFEEMGIEKEWWNESMENIDNRKIQEKEIERAREIIEEGKKLEHKLESREISKSRYDHEKLVVLGKKKAAFSTRCDLESEGITYDDLGELGEDLGDMCSEAAEDRRPAKFKEQVQESIDTLGPDFVENWKEEHLEKDDMLEEINERISRQVRMHRNRHNII